MQQARQMAQVQVQAQPTGKEFEFDRSASLPRLNSSRFHMHPPACEPTDDKEASKSHFRLFPSLGP